ncbi:MAG: glycosyltransferase family 4 protein [Ilumatobacteraceae bacterium]
MRIVLVVPGGVDPPGSPRVIPFIHGLVADLSSRHEVLVIAVGHDTAAGAWPLFGAEVINVPVGRHSKSDIARVVRRVSNLSGAGGRPDVIHGLWANLPGFAAAMAARRHRRPSVVSVCGGEFAALADIAYGGGLRRGSLLMAQASTRAATAVTVATSWMHAHVTGCGGRVDEIIPLGADTTIFSRPTSTPIPHRVAHVANLNRVKDQELLLQAFRAVVDAYPGAALDIAGLDTLDGQVQRLAATLGLDERVRFHGYLPAPELATMISDATLHVLSSRHDAGPVAVLEAAACGVATVGTAVGHVADLAALPRPGAFAVPGRRPAVLAEAILAVLADDEGRRLVADTAHAWALAHDAAHTSRAFEALYRRVSANR